jgi:hypothetical protein
VLDRTVEESSCGGKGGLWAGQPCAAIENNVKPRTSRSLAGELRHVAETQLANEDAVKQLEAWAREKTANT